jgi:hypothetical protein
MALGSGGGAGWPCGGEAAGGTTPHRSAERARIEGAARVQGRRLRQLHLEFRASFLHRRSKRWFLARKGHAGHAPAALAFELANRAYFAASISERGDEFYDQFTDRHRAFLAEQEAGIGACYGSPSGARTFGASVIWRSTGSPGQDVFWVGILRFARSQLDVEPGRRAPPPS